MSLHSSLHLIESLAYYRAICRDDGNDYFAHLMCLYGPHGVLLFPYRAFVSLRKKN